MMHKVDDGSPSSSQSSSSSNCKTMASKLKSKAPHSVTSMAILFSCMLVIFAMNLSQMMVLDGQGHQRSIYTLRGFLPNSSTMSPKLTQQERIRVVRHIPIPPRPTGIRKDIVKPGDFIYYRDSSRWDSAPIVLESHKLVFFSIPKVGCTVWKQLFRRMMGYDDWLSQDYEKMLPHNPETNGLKYLYDYKTEEASEMMTSPEWTRAMMVREPKQRFLSAFLDKSVSNDHRHIISKCCPDESCVEGAQTIEGFLKLVGTCHDDHWRPQHLRVDFKYWPYIDMVGHVEDATTFSKDLLHRIGAWDDFGASGWGEDGNATIFQSKGTGGAGVHATWAQWQVWKWYTPESEIKVEEFYRGDYENPVLNFTHYECFTCTL